MAGGWSSDSLARADLDVARRRCLLPVLGLAAGLILQSSPARSQAPPADRPGRPLVLAGETGPLDLRPHCRVLADPQRRHSFPGVLAAAGWLSFGDPGLAGTTGYWIDCRVRNQADHQTTWLVDLDTSFLHEALFYELTESGLTTLRTSSAIAGTSTDDSVFGTFPITLPPGLDRRFVMFCEAPPPPPPLRIWPYAAYFVRSQHTHLAMGMFLGVVFLFSIYNSFLALTLKERSYLLYVLYVLSSCGAIAVRSGLAPIYLGVPQVWANPRVMYLFVAGILAFGALFSRSFLETERFAPVAGSHLRGVAILAAGGAVIAAFGALQVVDLVLAVLGLLLLAGVFWGGLVCLWRGQRTSRFFLVAWLGVGTALFLISLGAVTGDRLVGLKSYELMSLGVTWETVFLSFALADRFRAIQERRILAEREAGRRRRELEQTYEAAPIGLAVVDRDGRFIQVNDWLRSFHELWTTDETPRSTADFRPELAARIAAQLAEVFAGGGSAANVELDLAARGDEGPIALVAGVRAVGGEAEAIVAIQNISDIRQEQQTRLSLEAQLEHSRRLETVGTMAGGIAHNFNNVLSPILGYTDLALRQVEGNPPVRLFLEKVATAARRARETVHQLLAFSRGVKPVKEPVSLRLVVGEAVDLVRTHLPPGVEIDVRHGAEQDLVKCDATELCQVLVNLLSNGVHALGDAGRVEVALTTADSPRSADPERWFHLSIRDDGQGMDEETLARACEPFFTTKEVGKGTGLGLSVAQGVVRGYGGELKIESRVGEGTTVHVLLPPAGEDSGAFTPVRKAGHQGSERILFVDDEPAIGELMQLALTELGYEIEVKPNGPAALAAFAAGDGAYDIVITDQKMPGMTGVELAGEIRRIHPGIPILLLTGDTTGIDMGNLKRLSLPPPLLKPVTAAEIGRAVRKLVSE